MHQKSACMEMYRWGYAYVPGILFCYAKELDLEMDDIGVLAAIFYTFERSKPLYETGIKIGQVLQACPSLSKQKFSRKLSKYRKLAIIEVEDNNKSFVDGRVYLEPLIEKLESLVISNHSQLSLSRDESKDEALLEEYRQKIEQLELALEEQNTQRIPTDLTTYANSNFKKMADFISKKTGNLMSVKMAGELRKWLEEMDFTPEFLLCMLELCFERNIYNPGDISRIARGLKEYAISNVEGLELYFKNYVDVEKSAAFRMKQFDPEIIEFGNFTGIDMNAEARRRIYYKWRYDWRFSHVMIMKAGEIMCQRTKNGGLEYIDSVLNNWMSKEIRQVEEAEKEILNFKSKNKKQNSKTIPSKTDVAKTKANEYEIYVPPVSMEDSKK